MFFIFHSLPPRYYLAGLGQESLSSIPFIPLPLWFLLVIFHPRAPTLLIGSKVPFAQAILESELSSILSSLFLYSMVLDKILFFTALTTVQLWFFVDISEELKGRVGNAKLRNQRNGFHWVTAWLDIPHNVPLLPTFPSTRSANNSLFPSISWHASGQDSAPVVCLQISTLMASETVSSDVDLLSMEQLLYWMDMGSRVSGSHRPLSCHRGLMKAQIAAGH